MSADPERVAFLADAYRARRRSPYAALVVEHRHLDFTIDECRQALAEVLAEAEAELVVMRACREIAADPVAARLSALLELDDAELEQLHHAGLLDDLELE